MGYLDRRRERMAKLVAQEVTRLEQAEVEKAKFPPGSTVTDATAMVAALAANSLPNSAYTQAQALPRMEPMVPFGPGIPVPPSPLNPLRPETGRPFPRQYEFPVSWNMPGQGERLLPFRVLRDFADRVDAARYCIEIRKGEIIALDWDVVLRPEAVESVMAKSGISNQPKAARMAREQYASEIDRMKTFWERPDRLNALIFPEWLTLILEEHFVIDAVCIYPHLDMKGELHSLEILDGSTIKPLLNSRGGMPQAPEPAYQQILYGFPRGEFTVSTGVDSEFTSDQLIYKPRHRRSWTPYGQPPTEMALLTGDLYLKRQGWVRSEYTAGTLPELIIETDADLSPDQLRWYEEVFNEDLSGDTDARHRARFLPRGFRPSPLSSFAERYSPEYDEYLLTLICAAYDVQPMELGIMPRGGLGGKGLGDSQENTTYRKSIRPTTAWLVSILNEISYQWLGMPRELSFSFQGLEAEDEFMVAKTRDIQVRTGGRTVNELRGEQGLPQYEFAEADMPFMLTQRGIIFLEGSSAAGLQVDIVGAVGPSPVAPKQSIGAGDNPPTPKPTPKPTGKSASEARTFVNFAEKRVRAGKWRDFEFNDVAGDSARLLNLLGESGDLLSIKALVADITKKQSQEAVHYREGTDVQSCGKCMHFEPSTESCAFVEGDIDPDDLCDLYERGRHGAADKQASPDNYAGPASGKDALVSIAHRTSSISNHLAHARRHLDQAMMNYMQGDSDRGLFNRDHAVKHMDEASTEAAGLAKNVSENPALKEEFDALEAERDKSLAALKTTLAEVDKIVRADLGKALPGIGRVGI